METNETMQDIEDTSGAILAVDAHTHERRRSRRFPCNGYAEGLVSHPRSLFRGEMRDISQGGFFVMTKAILRAERLTEVDLRFTIRNRHYQTTARIMNLRPGKGIGLEFSFSERRTRELFHALVAELRAEGPAE